MGHTIDLVGHHSKVGYALCHMNGANGWEYEDRYNIYFSIS